MIAVPIPIPNEAISASGKRMLGQVLLSGKSYDILFIDSSPKDQCVSRTS